MKAWYRRGFIGLSLCVIGLVILLLGNSYVHYVSQRVYVESTGYLAELYGQVNYNLHAFWERNWGNLDDWTHHLQIEDEKGVLTFLKSRQAFWKFSTFYFLAPGGRCLTPEGVEGTLTLEDAMDDLFLRGEPVIANEHLPSGQAITIFAIPVPQGRYRSFDYTAIAVSYTHDAMIQSLDVAAFSDQSMCYVMETDGRVLLSTHANGGADNYLSYLRTCSNLDEAALDQLCLDWKRGGSGVFRCKIEGVSHYLSYQPVGYQDCILLGVVPEAAASTSLLQIQHATIDVLVKIFLLLGVFIVSFLISLGRRQTKKSVLELQYRELMFDTLSNNVDDIFLMLDKKTWRADYLSPNVERLLGIPLGSAEQNPRLLGESVVDAYGFISWEEFDAIPIHGCRHWEREHIHQKTGERRWYRETIYHESIQGMEKYVVVMSDRTQERQLNSNLQEALDAAKSANSAKSHFLSNMSHDIRTPMNAIMGFAVLLAKDADNPEKVRDYTRKISASSQHLLSLINDVLDMSKIESGKTSLNVAPFSLPELLEDLHTILLPQAKAKGQTLEFRVQGRPSEHLLGDKLRLNQILINLLSNSIKYTQDGGCIDFVVQELPQTAPQYAHLGFVVQDNGIGMSEEFLKIVFDPFARELNSTTSGIQGTGLGMAITKNLVELMGGVIHVTSKLHQGSTFTVELTFALPAQPSGEPLWRRHGISRILVADDDEEVGRDIQALMQDTGITVHYVTEGSAAVEAAVEAQARGKPFHVILLDWKMPGQNGVETAQQIRTKLEERIPILVLTSYDWSDIEDEARAAGIDAFLPKPFFISTFQQALDSLYGEEALESSSELDHTLQGLLFLVAEDNELNAEILSEMLDMEGAKCELAVNGQEALEMFQRSEPGHYDMILMDVQMPVMGGYEATRQIRACGHPRAASIPIVAMTANAFTEDVRNALDSGMNGHLSKPIDMVAMKTLLSRLKTADISE